MVIKIFQQHINLDETFYQIHKHQVTEIGALQKKETEKNKEQIQEQTKEKETHVQPIQQNKSRCMNCSKKVGLLGHECSCSFVFCSKCRHPEDHMCQVNYMEKGKQQIAKNNPLIQEDKLVRL